MKIFVIGGAGSIGSELCNQLSKKNKVIAIDQDETGLYNLSNVIPEIANIRDYERMKELFEEYRPQKVFHAAAYKHLSRYERENFSEVIMTNVIGTMNILRLVKEFKVKKFIFISTDKAVEPVSLMGATKLLGEIMTKRCGYIAVRFGNVMGSRGSVMEIWQKQIEKGEPITITDTRMERYFMSIPEACERVIEASEMGIDKAIFVPHMGSPIKIVDLVERLRDYSKKDLKIKIIGKKENERLTEKLLTDEEKQVAIKKNNFWIII